MGLSEELINLLTPPTTPEIEEKESVWIDKDLAKSAWKQEDGDYQERTYQCGKSTLSQRNLAFPRESEEEAARVRPLKELPEWSRVLEWEKGYVAGKTYPRLSREETDELIQWCDGLPEYEGGGFEFLLHQTGARTIAVTLIGDERSPKRPRMIGERVLEVKRTREGWLYEVFASRTVSRGRYQQSILLKDVAMEVNSEEAEQTAPPPQDTGVGNSPPTLEAVKIPGNPNNPTLVTPTPDPTSNRTYACLATIVVHDKEPERPESANCDQHRDGIKDNSPKTEVPWHSPEYLQAWNNPHKARDYQVQKEISRTFPVPRTITYAPPPKNRTNGVLAAGEVRPYAQYDDCSDFAFYAKGITLVLDDNEGVPTYYSGNAAIRVSRRDLDPSLIFPKRKRTSYLRDKMFQMSARPRQIPDRRQEDLPGMNETLVGTHETAPLTRDGDKDHTIASQEAATEPKPDIGQNNGENAEAVRRTTVNDSTDETDEIQTYWLRQKGDGTFFVARAVAEYTPPVDGQDTAVGSEVVRRNNDLEKEAIDLTKKGNDPHPSAGEIDAETQICEKIRWSSTSMYPEAGDIQGQDRSEEPHGLGRQEVSMCKETSSIKEKEKAHLDPIPDNFFSRCLPSKPICELVNIQPTCLPPMPPRPLRNVPLEPSPLSQSRTSSLHGQRCTNTEPPSTGLHSHHQSNLPMGYSAPLGGGDVIRPTIDAPLRPGLMAANHLVERPRPGSDPHELWFAGSSATLVYEDENGVTRTRCGNSELRFYEQSGQNSGNTLPPPPPQRVNEARVQLFRDNSPDSSVDRDPGARAQLLGEIEPSLRNFRLNPMVPVFQPGCRTCEMDPLREPDGVRVDENPAGRDAAELLLQLRNSKAIEDSPNQDETRARSDSIGSSEPDENPAKTIKFVHGGTLPGTLDRSRPSSPSLWLVELDDDDLSRPGTKAIASPIGSPAKNEPSTHPITEPGVADMDVDRQAPEPSDSPPELAYPTSEGTSSTDSELTNGTPVYRQSAPQDAGQPTPTPNDQCSSQAVKPRRQVSRAFLHYAVWREVVGEIQQKLKDGGDWSDREIQERLAAFNLLPWWYDIHLKESGGHAEDWERWRTRIVDVWRKQRPEVPAEVFEKMVSDLKELDQETRAARPLQCHAVVIEMGSVEEDVEMKTDDAPKSPQIIPVWVPSSPPPKAHDVAKEETTETGVAQEEWKELQERVWTLEKRVTDTTDGIQDRLTRLGDQVYEDGIIVADLKWRMAEIDELEEKAKTAGKRLYKKARGKVATHRYPTRYSGSQADEVLELGRKEFGDVAARIQAVEERMEDMKKEKERLEAELTRLDALTPKIDALALALEDFKNSQLKINIGSFQHFATLRDLYVNTVVPRIDAHSREIAALNARYNSLYAVAVDVLKPSQSGRRPPMAKPKRTSPVTPVTLQNAFNKISPLPPLRQPIAVL